MKSLVYLILFLALIFNITGCSKDYIGVYRSKPNFFQEEIIELKSNGDFEFIMNEESIFSGEIVEKNGTLTLKLEDGSILGEFKFDDTKLTSMKQLKGSPPFEFELLSKGQVFMRERKK